MTRDDIEKLADKHQEKADKAMHNYQCSGEQRYYREHSKNSELATALRIAANAADDHNMAITYSNYIASWAKSLQAALHFKEPLDNIAKEIVGYAEFAGLISKI